MQKLPKTLLSLALIASVPLASFAETSAEDIINAGGTPEEIGLNLAKEGDARDFGFGDTSTTLRMVLTNKQGHASNREMRNLVFEMEDENVGDKSMIIFDNPRDVAGTAFLTHSKILDPDDQWLYLPALKRVKRISSKNKSGPFVGSEFAYEDLASQEVGKYSYKYTGSEPCPTDSTLTCAIVERTPLYPDSGYTKQIAWIDYPELRLQKVDFYDRKESLLKTLTYTDYAEYLGQYWRGHTMSMQNHQNGKSTVLKFDPFKFKAGLSENDFTEAQLRRAR